jgi:hypothetical protein
MNRCKAVSIVMCNVCHYGMENSHVISILMEMEDGTVGEWEDPPHNIVKMFMKHPNYSIVYQSCNRS